MKERYLLVLGRGIG